MYKIYTYIYNTYTIYIYIYIYIYMYIYIKNETFISKQVIFWFLPILRRLNSITKSVKSLNLKTN